jgi:hypothetical protein
VKIISSHGIVSQTHPPCRESWVRSQGFLGRKLNNIPNRRVGVLLCGIQSPHLHRPPARLGDEMQVRGCGCVALACLQVRKSEATIWCCIGPRSTNWAGSGRPPSRGIAGKWQLLQISFLRLQFFHEPSHPQRRTTILPIAF